LVQLLALINFILYSKASRPPLVSRQHPIHWVSGAIFTGVKHSGHEGDHSAAYGVEIKNKRSNVFTPTFFRGLRRDKFTCLLLLNLSSFLLPLS
jgi:hypothetical protein